MGGSADGALEAVVRSADQPLFSQGSLLGQAQQEKVLRECLTSGRGIPLSKLLDMMEYPNDVLPMYSEGYSLVKFLMQQDGGRLAFIEYVQDAMDSGDWRAASNTACPLNRRIYFDAAACHNGYCLLDVFRFVGRPVVERLLVTSSASSFLISSTAVP
jgi:hypothetical protein